MRKNNKISFYKGKKSGTIHILMEHSSGCHNFLETNVSRHVHTTFPLFSIHVYTCLYHFPPFSLHGYATFPPFHIHIYTTFPTCLHHISAMLPLQPQPFPALSPRTCSLMVTRFMSSMWTLTVSLDTPSLWSTISRRIYHNESSTPVD